MKRESEARHIRPEEMKNLFSVIFNTIDEKLWTVLNLLSYSKTKVGCFSMVQINKKHKKNVFGLM